jgi:transposase
MQIEITDEQWQHINKFIPRRKRSKDGKGRPQVDNRLILNGVLWIMWTGSPWAALR